MQGQVMQVLNQNNSLEAKPVTDILAAASSAGDGALVSTKQGVVTDSSTSTTASTTANLDPLLDTVTEM